jgi:large subunit ribosomal protein L10
MAITRTKKEEIFKKIGGILSKSQSVVFVNFHGLNVIDTTELRSNLRKEGIDYTVAKKTLIKKALEETKTEGDIPPLEGEVALAYGEDLIAPARGVYSFQKNHTEEIQILGGIFQGLYKNKEEMLAIAQIPPVNVLYGQFVNLINTPIQQLVSVFGEIEKKKA